jgi:hypothetical protein
MVDLVFARVVSWAKKISGFEPIVSGLGWYPANGLGKRRSMFLVSHTVLIGLENTVGDNIFILRPFDRPSSTLESTSGAPHGVLEQ